MINRRTLISRVSEHTNYSPEVVGDILEGFTDIAIEELDANGSFYFNPLFKIVLKDWHTKSFDGSILPDHKRAVVTVGNKLKILLKIRRDILKDRKGTLTRNNWKNIFEEYNPRYNNKTSDNYNPLLDEEDEDY